MLLRNIATRSRIRVSPAEQGEKFEVPRLMSDIQGILELADTDIFMEYHDWSLLNYSPKMDEDEFMIRETARSFEIDIEGKRVTYGSLQVKMSNWLWILPRKAGRQRHLSCGSTGRCDR